MSLPESGVSECGRGGQQPLPEEERSAHSAGGVPIGGARGGHRRIAKASIAWVSDSPGGGALSGGPAGPARAEPADSRRGGTVGMGGA